MSVRDICNRNVVVTGRATTVSDGATLMRNMHIGDLVVARPMTTTARSGSSPIVTSSSKWSQPVSTRHRSPSVTS